MRSPSNNLLLLDHAFVAVAQRLAEKLRQERAVQARTLALCTASQPNARKDISEKLHNQGFQGGALRKGAAKGGR